MTPEIRKALQEFGRQNAKKLNNSLTPEQRSESARRAANARWKKHWELQSHGSAGVGKGRK